MDLWLIAVNAFWLIAPAYGSNAFPPLVGGKRSVDFGRTFRGKRIFGDGKTIEGSLAGILFGLLIGSIQLLFQPALSALISPYGPFIFLTLPLVLLLSMGAIAGDMLGSFIKRQLCIERGKPAPLLDQLDFIVVSILFTYLFFGMALEVIVFIIIVTPVIHYVANIIGFVLRIKKHPW
ncbi:MAG: CDP-2,3-bis-(O-geranylgeranyl)-sn-glycerol synthase [Candidatus Aenigmarchaeota archaeon]|nr:CDP-2,3-bis-(O-geranylgeranyl)-sn-glycerol synthase [Candidatus Aenigmarchaeota archaeon]